MNEKTGGKHWDCHSEKREATKNLATCRLSKS
jgi:hypothetical protein